MSSTPDSLPDEIGALKAALMAARTARRTAMYSLIVTARLNDIDPRAWLADALHRINDHPTFMLDELLPWNWPSNRARLAA